MPRTELRLMEVRWRKEMDGTHLFRCVFRVSSCSLCVGQIVYPAIKADRGVGRVSFTVPKTIVWIDFSHVSLPGIATAKPALKIMELACPLSEL